jgi:hypothetical protein
MNHQPFREWLLSEQELSPQQAQQLENHLSLCQDCNLIRTSWKEIEDAFDKLPDAEPKPGFTSRWQSQLEGYRLVQQKRRGWFIISGIAVVVISLLATLIYQSWSLFLAPDSFLAIVFERLMGLLSIYFSFRNIISTYTWPTPMIMFIGMIFFVGVLSFLCVAWLATYRKISLARRAL